MALSLADIQAKLKLQEEKKGTWEKGDTSVYPLWNNPENSTAVIRFIPDGDATNDFFWRENLTIKLPFAGIKGSKESNQTFVKVPCMNMWEKNGCPISAEIRPWWDDADLKKLASTYWRKKTYFLQGFVVNSPMKEEEVPENLIRRFVITPSIFDKVKAILLEEGLASLPTDYDNGYDFFVRKSAGAKFPNYDNSSWTKSATTGIQPRALSDEERAAIENPGPFVLKDFLPKKPDSKHLEIIMEMFRASVDGEAYDPDKFGEFYRPSGFKSDEGNETFRATPAVTAAPVTHAPKTHHHKEEAETVVETKQEVKPMTGKTPEEIIATIKARRAAQ